MRGYSYRVQPQGGGRRPDGADWLGTLINGAVRGGGGSDHATRSPRSIDRNNQDYATCPGSCVQGPRRTSLQCVLVSYLNPFGNPVSVGPTECTVGPLNAQSVGPADVSVQKCTPIHHPLSITLLHKGGTVSREGTPVARFLRGLCASSISAPRFLRLQVRSNFAAFRSAKMRNDFGSAAES